MQVWTDYPFKELGDIPYQKAPIREAKAISYDGNKYIKIKVIADEVNHTTTVKAGYIYSQKGRYGEVPNLSESVLNTLTFSKV